MARIFPALLILAFAVVTIVGCASDGTQAVSSAKTEKPAASAAADGKAIYICHMGADCGLSKVGPGEKVPSCCGKEMVKADPFCCTGCGKQQIIAAGKHAPECCGAAMKKIQP